jgi:hypothetical protein
MPLIPQPLSELEAALALQILARGLPEPVRQFKFAAERRWAADFAWPIQSVIAECEGATWLGKKGGHTSGQGFQSGCEKANAATLKGWRYFRFTKRMVDDGTAIDVLEKALAKETRK